jgi:dienelactone hydrolase
MNKFFLILVISLSLAEIYSCRVGKSVSEDGDHKKRVKDLAHLVATYKSDKDEKPNEVPIWEHWLKKSGELPPDFDKLPSNALLPDLLKFQNGDPVSDSTKWPARKEEIKNVLRQYMLGDWPPIPPKIAVKYRRLGSIPPLVRDSVAEDNDLYIRKDLQLFFAPSEKAVEFAAHSYRFSGLMQTSKYWSDYSQFTVATLNVELYLPKKGNLPYPAIIVSAISAPEQKALLPQDVEKLKRGYAVVRYFRKDADYIPAVYVEYECNQLEWWAYAASRCVDFLYTLPDIDKSKIAIAGHSRLGKTALMAAAMDSRINAVIVSHPGTGAGSFNLWRYAGDKFGAETLENSTRQYQYWNNPRMRFFIGRENKLPFDNHYLVSLVAPRSCLLGTGEHDFIGEVWGDQQCYLEVNKVYKLLGEEQRLGFYTSPGGHEETSSMIESQLDWLDMQFGRKPYQFENKLPYTYSFDEWKRITGEHLDKQKFPEKTLHDILKAGNGKDIKTTEEWETKAANIKKQIKWVIGDLPAYSKIDKAVIVNEKQQSDINAKTGWPVNDTLAKAEIAIDDKLHAHITYPKKRNGKLPVVIYLHAYLDAVGYNWPTSYGYSPSVADRLAQNGYMAVEFDQFGYGKRNNDSGIEFYKKNAHTSAVGVMIQDVSKVIDAISLLDLVDKDKIMVCGYSLGGIVALYAAVFDARIGAVATTSGFASMRMDVHGKKTEGIRRYSHLRPTIPRLGMFLGDEKRIPYDFHEVLALIAPRPVFILAPKFDQDWLYEDVETCYREAAKIFDLYGKRQNIMLHNPDDFNRYPPEYQQTIIDWFKKIP